MKFLFAPIKIPMKINQRFGENKTCIPISGNGSAINCNGLNPPAGYKSIYSKMKGHNGLDIDAYRWQPVYASQDGVVSEVVSEEKRGLGLGITTTRKFYCEETGKDEYFKVRYWHFIAMNVHYGDEVKVGQLIGFADSTGYSTGDHLHFEIKPVKKTGIRKDKSSGQSYPVTENILQKNGFYGAVDPLPYMFTDKFAMQISKVRWVFEWIAANLDKLSNALRR